MSSNLYKSNWVVMQDSQVRVIDNNELLEKKLSAALHAAASAERDGASPGEKGFAEGLDAENIDSLLAQEGEGALIRGESEKERDALLQEIQQAKEELADLKSQADGMIEDAKAQIGAMQMKAYEEAKNQGYQEGSRLGRAEADAVKKEYLEKTKQLELEYQQKIEELEPEFIDVLTDIYEHIFKVDLSRYRDLVVGLISNTMGKTEEARNFLVHVSKDDYEAVMAQREQIRADAGGGNVTVEIVEDLTLSQSQCMIETENGIYDCSLDTQLSELGRKLKLLSYEKK